MSADRSRPPSSSHSRNRRPHTAPTAGLDAGPSGADARSYSSAATAAATTSKAHPPSGGGWAQKPKQEPREPLTRPNGPPPTVFQFNGNPYAKNLSTMSSATDLYSPALEHGPTPPADQPGCHEHRRSCRVQLPNGEWAEMVLAETWTDADAHVDWLLEDAVVDGFVTQDSLKRIKLEDRKRAKANAAAIAAQPDPWGDASSSTADDFADMAAGTGSSSSNSRSASPHPHHRTTFPQQRTYSATEDQSYLLGLDTESYHLRVESATTHAFWRKFPATIQLSSRLRVLVVPVYWLVAHQNQPVSHRFRSLFSQSNVRWTGVGLAGDLSPFQDTLQIKLPRDRIVDADAIVNKWRIPGSLDELAYQLTDLFSRASPDTSMDTDSSAVQSFGDIAIDPQPTISAKFLNNYHTHMSTCPTCLPNLASLDPAHIPPFLYLEDGLIGIGTGPTYPNLTVGWKSKHLSMTNWDVAPHHWTSSMLIYSGLDALASRAVGVAIMPVINPYTWIHATTSPDPPMRISSHYQLPHVRQFPGAPLEWLRCTLAHIVTCREAGRPSVATVHKYVSTWKLLKGIKSRRAVMLDAIDWFVTTGVVTAVDQLGNKVDNVKSANEANVYLTHVCLAATLVPKVPPQPMLEHPGGVPAPGDWIAFVSQEYPRVPGYGDHVTSEAVHEFLARTHPALALFDESDSLRVAKAWVDAAPEEGVLALIQDLKKQVAQMERALVDRAAAKREERAENGGKKKRSRGKGKEKGKGVDGKDGNEEQAQGETPQTADSAVIEHKSLPPSVTAKRRSSESRRESTWAAPAPFENSGDPSFEGKKHRAEGHDVDGRSGHGHRGRGGRGRGRGGNRGGSANGGGTSRIVPA
ncbi:hypothetical protein BCR44DRAFT_1432343 [Catenaria anguillulae PL171]|uniref:Uncharacterized protein n=1 Tax=Catenaria anguillulae PL171 TaxID=765915 RepID=A0A1Y2HPX0_9FUNG|nr:hypothetical protein BCR44DRAFT_1432343 [Catenaria anguillulae PL171]